MSLRNFEPVFLPEGRDGDSRASQTFLRHFNACPRAGYLYALTKGGAGAHALHRGAALHRVLELATLAIVEENEPVIPPEIVKDIVNEVLSDPAYLVPIEEHDYLRECAYRWAAETAIEPLSVVACERLFVMELEGFQIRAKIDLGLLLDGGARVLVRDYKSSRSMPSFEEMSRKRSDGSLMAKSFQLVLYALMVAFGRPVREEWHLGERTEIIEPFGVADRAQQFDMEFVYPGIVSKFDDRMATRPVSLTRLELEEYRASLAALLRRVRHAFDAGDWPAIPGSHCTECPARSMCPIPAEYRSHAGTINTIEEAQEAAEKLFREQDEHKARREEIKRFAKAHDIEIRIGLDKAWRFVPKEVEEIRDKDGMFAAMQRAMDYGEPFDRSKFVKHRIGTDFRIVTLSEEELAEEAAAREEAAA